MKKDDSTRERIIATGKKLFSAKGYLGTSMNDIADDVGITKASLYYFYKNKQSLYLTVIADVYSDVERVFQKFPQDSYEAQDLEKLILTLIKVLRPHGALLDSIEPSHFDTSDPEFMATMEREMQLDTAMQHFLKRCGVKQTALASHTVLTGIQGILLRLKYNIEDITPKQFARYQTSILIT